MAVNMVLDVLAERGYTVTLDVMRSSVPSHVEPFVPGDATGARIVCRTEKSFKFHVSFPPPEIRRNE